MSTSSLDQLRSLLETEGALPQVLPPQLQQPQRVQPQPQVQQQQPYSSRPAASGSGPIVVGSPSVTSPAQQSVAGGTPAPEADVATHRCSQCKQSKPLEAFPTRLATLQPFLVCKSHAWYWTEEKQQLHWAPERESSINVVCEDVRRIAEGQKKAGSWIVMGGAEDRAAIVKRIAAIKQWNAVPIAVRKSRASGPAPPRPFHYQIKSQDTDPEDKQWRLVLTLHDTLGKYVISFKEDVGRKAGTWAKKPRKEEQARKDAVENGEGEGGSSAEQSDASFQPPLTNGTSSRPRPRPPPQQVASPSGDINVNDSVEMTSSLPTVPSPRPRPRTISTSNAVAQAPPAKRVRRVEPSQLPPSRPLLPNPAPELVEGPSTLGFVPPLPPPKHTPSLIFVQPPTPPRPLDGSTPMIAPRAAFAQLPHSAIRTTEQPRRSISPIFDPALVRQVQSTPTQGQGRRASSQQPHTFEGLTLDQLLASPFLDPPSIPLQQRTMQLKAAAYTASRSGGGSGSRGRSVSEGARGAERSVGAETETAQQQHQHQQQSRGGGQGRRRDEGAESADETDLEDDEQGTSEDDGEDDDDGGDWLTGFVKGQLHGIGEPTQEEVDELEESEGD